ncbi:hypothetical protein [Desulfobacterium sp. N47]|uniref:hypothetical protein n=1 Tax=Desulfobacterium sp. N47 TaxID=3115210 RepID=UPI003F49EAF1
MKSKASKPVVDDLRPEYDFDYSKAVRGKYYRRLLEEGSNVIILEPEIAKAFHDSASVNEALRSLLLITQSTKRLTTSRSTGSSKKRASR